MIRAFSRLVLLASFICIIQVVRLEAVCTGSSPTWTCPFDTNFASINNLLSGTQAGFTRNDTINVSTGSPNTNTSITISKGVSLICAGTCTATASADNPFILATPDATSITNSDNITVRGFTFNGNNVVGIFVNLSGASGISGTKPYQYYRILNNTFKNQVSATASGGITAANANGNGQLRGVVANNTFDRFTILYRVFSNNDTSESSNATFNNPCYACEDSLYFENNAATFSSAYDGSGEGNAWIESGQGGRLVVRFSTWNMTNTTCVHGGCEFNDVHGFQGWNGTVNSGQTGTMSDEYYDNTWSNISFGTRANDLRGGQQMFFDNTWTGSADVHVELYGESPTGSCGTSINPVPSNYTPQVHNTYYFNNTSNGTQLNAADTGGSPTHANCTVLENANWWNYNASFTGTTGIGRGVLASRPATCTTGVGYWATDQGKWNWTSSNTNDGAFYKCTSTNTWTLYYTPYDYPHPLADFTAPIAGNSGTITTSGLTTTAITANWTKATDDRDDPKWIAYEGCISTSNNVTSVGQCEAATLYQTSTLDIATATATGLTSGTTYFLNVVGIDKAGNKTAFTPVSATTSSNSISHPKLSQDIATK